MISLKITLYTEVQQEEKHYLKLTAANNWIIQQSWNKYKEIVT